MSQPCPSDSLSTAKSHDKFESNSQAKSLADIKAEINSGTIPLDHDTPGQVLRKVEESSTMVAQSFKTSTNIKKKRKRGLKPAAPADTVTRGFHTPTTSGGEESDVSAVSTPKLRPSKQPPLTPKDSPLIRGSSLTRAISALKLGNDDIVLDGSDKEMNHVQEMKLQTFFKEQSRHTKTCQIAAEPKFASEADNSKKIIRAIEGGLRHDSPHRKMAASDFETLKCLGKGAYGTVVLVRQRSTGRLFAQKQLKKASLTIQKRLVEQTKNERVILESVNSHPFVVKLFYAFQDQQKLYLILEYAQGGELFHHLALERTFTEEVAAFYMAEMVIALEYLHTNFGVVYRDLKPENCLLDAEGHLLLTDFGLSKIASEDPSSTGSDGKCNSILGTVDYMAPEVIQGRPYDATVDWWSLGALGFDLLTGSPPFSSNNYTKTQQKIVHNKLVLPYYLSPDAKDILTRLLRKDPRKRLGGNMPTDIKTIRGHRFFRKINWHNLKNREILAPIQPIITDPASAENFASEFTELALSPVEPNIRASFSSHWIDSDCTNEPGLPGKDQPDDTFGGFSYVASRSLIEAGGQQ